MISYDVSFSVLRSSRRITIPASTHYAATGLMTQISLLSDIALYVRATTSLSIFCFLGYLPDTVDELLVNTAVSNIGMAVCF